MPANPVQHEPVHYQLDPRPKRGLALGLSLSRLAGIVFGIAGAVVTVVTSRSLVAAFVPAALGALWAWFPIRGRPAAEALPTLVSHQARTLMAEDVWSVPVRLERVNPIQGGLQVLRSGRRSEQPVEHVLDWPPELGGSVSLVETRSGYETVALIADRRSHRPTYVLLLDASAPGWTLVDPSERDRRVAAWAGVLSGLARERNLALRLQVVEALRPDPGIEQAAWIEAHAPGGDVAEVERYRQLVIQHGGSAVAHEVTLALRVAPMRARDRLDVALRELNLLRQSLTAAGISAKPLDPATAAQRLRLALTPDPRLASRPLRPLAAGPSSRLERDDHVTVDGWHHSVFWIAEWPRSAVRADWMLGLLAEVPGTAARSFVLHLEALPPVLARRQAERDRLNYDLDAVQRRRLGFVESAARRREVEGAVAREEELATGAALLRYVGLIDLASQSLDELASAREHVAQLAAKNLMVALPLDAQQHLALAACVPLGRLDFAKGWQA